MDIPWNVYEKYIDTASELYADIFGEPKTHHEYMNSFNIKGMIIRTLIKNLKDVSTRFR
jgi:hypothetical protein